MKTKVSDLIALYLKNAKIEKVFGVIGSANSHIFNSIKNLGYTEIICVHHEQSAVMAMGSYYRSSGKLSASIVTAGAGAANAITGVISNWADSIPGIIISGQEKTEFIDKYKENRMCGIQGFDISTMVSKITKYSKTITDVSEIQSIIETAHKITQSSRKGPVWIDVPFDIQSRAVIPREWDLHTTSSDSVCDALPISIYLDMKYISDRLNSSKRPLIIAGHGIKLSNAKEKFRSICNELKIPIILTWSGIDILEETHPYYYGRSGVHGFRYSNFLVQNSDFILVIGSRLSLLQTGYNIDTFAPNAKIAVVDIDRSEYNKYPNKYDKTIDMDCGDFLDELSLININVEYKNWISYCDDIKSKYPIIEKCHDESNPNYINSYKFIYELSDHILDDSIITTDMGTALLSGHYSIKLKKDQQMFTSLGLGEMGYGLPSAIGAAIANPTKQIICLNCDGGMMMNLQELQTIAHHNLNIKIVIFNNDGYLMIKHTQNMLFNGNKTSVDASTGLSLPDYKQLSNAFGFKYDTISNNNNNVNEKILNWLSSASPSVLEVFMNPNQEFLPKVKANITTSGDIIPGTLEEMYPVLSFDQIKEAMISGIREHSINMVR